MKNTIEKSRRIDISLTDCQGKIRITGRVNFKTLMKFAIIMLDERAERRKEKRP